MFGAGRHREPAPRTARRAYHPRMPELLLVLIVILVLALLWRGPKTLPQLGEALGRGIREARREAADATKELGKDDEPPRT
jgi:Sec-independent protein translocase protein TatA